MEKYQRELTPVKYSSAGIKTHRFTRQASRVCTRLHWHARMELIRVYHGEMTVGYGPNTAVLTRGGMYIIPPKTPHTAIAGPDGVEYGVVMFDVQAFYNDTAVTQSLLSGLVDGRAKLALTTYQPEIIRSFDRITACHEAQPLLAVSLVYSLLDGIFQHCLQSFSEHISSDAIQQTVQYIKEHYAEELTVELLAQHCGYSPAHFCRKFKDAIWLTPMNFLKIYRLEEAARMLKEHDYSVSDVASRCGFQDSNYFTRCFKKHFGVPPTKLE